MLFIGLIYNAVLIAQQPTISSFTPTSASKNSVITITGTNFTGITNITLGGTSVASFTVVSSNTIQAMVGLGATGDVSVSTSGGTVALSGFTFLQPTPSITSFTPTSAGIGTAITITGTNLIGTTIVTLGGTPVTSFQVLSSTTITAIIGNGASGSLNLTTAGGTAALSGFTFIPPPPNNVSGIISTNITWTKANSPYFVTGNTQLNSGYTLTIEPGVVVNFSANTYLKILGNIIANGTSTDSIIFKSVGNEKWAGIQLISSLANINSDYSYANGSIFKYARFDNSTKALFIYNSSFYVENCNFTNNTIGFEPRSTTRSLLGSTVFKSNTTGIYTEYEDYTSGYSISCIKDLRITSNSFINNNTGANLNMNQRTFDNLEILNNSFQDNSSGLILGGGGYGPYLANVSIKKNIFYKNANGLSISTIYGNGYNGCSGTISFPLIIENNLITTSSSSGLSFNFASSDHTIRNNIISNNEIGLSISGTTSRLTFLNNNIVENKKSVQLNGGAFYEPSDIIFSKNYFKYNGPNNTDYIILNNVTNNSNRSVANNFDLVNSTYLIKNTNRGNYNFDSNHVIFPPSTSNIKDIIYDINNDVSYGEVKITNFNNIDLASTPIGSVKNLKKSLNNNQVTLSWTNNSVSDYAGSKIYYGGYTGFSYSNVIDAGNDSSYTLPVGVGINENIAVTNYDQSANGIDDQYKGNESWYSIATIASNALTPTITSFTPASAGTGATITITGTNLNNTSAITLGGISVASFQVLSSTIITAVVGAGATGAVSVTTAGGTTALSGFTFITPPPTITSFAPNSGPVGTLVTITGTNLNNPTAINIGGVTAIPISFSGNTVVAMVMPGATKGVVRVTTSGGIANGSIDFTTIASSVPSTQQGNKLVGTGSVGNSYQGERVALSADGNTAIVGGSYDDGFKGAAWIYTRSGTTWTQQGNKLVGSGAAGTSFQGSGVALSADGNTAIIGGYADDNNKGAAWIFTRNGTTWVQQGSKLVGTGAIGSANQGYSVAISADGNTATIGGWADDNNKGAVWVFTRNGNTWSQMGNKLVGSGAVGNPQQGFSVALSADGNTIIIGGNGDNNTKGAAWAFTRSSNSWTQQGNKLVGADVVGNPFLGMSVAVSADGNTAILGGFKDSTQGAAWVFTRTGNSWSQQGRKLVATGSVGYTEQGIGVAISADGNTAIIGDRIDINDQGGAWIYTRNGEIWTQRGDKISGIGASGSPQKGSGVALSSDGNTAIIGGPADDNSKGAAWIFISAPSTLPVITSFTPTAAGTGNVITITGTNLTGTTAITLGGTAVSSFTVVAANTITAVVGTGSTGALSLVTPGGSASLPGFIFITAAPSVNSLSTATCSGASFTLSPVDGINGTIPSGTTYSWSAPTLAAGLSGGVSLSNQKFISGSLSNASNSVKTAIYTVVPSHPTLGIGAPFTVTVLVNPELVITPLSITGCGKMIFKTIPLTNTNGPVLDSALHTWTTPNQTVSFITRVRPENNFNSVDSINWTNEFNFTKTFYYNPNPSGSCLGPNYKLDVYLNPIPSIKAITANNCSGVPFVLSPANGINGIVPDSISYSWNNPILSGSLTGGNSGSNMTSIKGQLFNLSNVTQTATYFITPISTNGNCMGAAFTLTVSVNPAPIISPKYITTSSGIPFAFTPNNGLEDVVPANSRYSWSLPVLTATSIVGAQNASGQSNIFGSLTNNTTNFQTATYSVTPQSGICIGNAFTVSVTMNPKIFITSFAPASAGTGAMITIRGKGLTNLNQISFGGTAASSFTIVSDSTATAIVGAGSSGIVKITSPYASDSLAGFTYGLPVIQLYSTDTTLTFGAEKGKYSRSLNYSVSANYLQNALLITAPDNFQVSKFPDSAYSSSLSLNHQNGTIDSTKIYVRFKLDTLGTYSGSIVHTSLAATARSITVTGSSKCDSVVYITPVVNNILSDTIICFKDSLVLGTNSGTFGNYLWSTGDTTKNLVIKSSGNYSLQVGSGKGCLSYASRIIKTNKNTNPVPSLALIGNKTLISSNAPKYRWLFNNTYIPGNNTNSLVPSKVGFYTVETSNDSICWDRSTDYPIFVLSNPLVNDTLAVKVFPNPTSTGTFFVVASLQRSTNVVARVTIVDGNGNVLLQTNKFIFFGREVKIPITLAIKGTVFAKIDINGDVKTQTVILQ